MTEPADEVLVADVTAWHDWLQRHHATAQSAWVVLTKKGKQAPTTLTFEEAMAETLCFGWIDNKTMRRDDVTYRMRVTPRRPGGTWSASNVRLAELLIADGRMQPAGLAEVERAKSDGRWRQASSDGVAG